MKGMFNFCPVKYLLYNSTMFIFWDTSSSQPCCGPKLFVIIFGILTGNPHNMFFDSVPLRAPALSILCCLREDNLLDLPVIATFKALCIKTWVLPCNVADHTQKIYFYCCSLRTVLHWNFGLSGLVWMETLLSVMVVKFELFSSKIASIMEEGPWQHGPTNRAFSLMAQLERRWLQAENSTNSW